MINVSEMVMIGGIFLENASYVAWHKKKSWAFSDLVAAFSAALHETFVRSKYANSVSQFLIYWMRIICCICEDFVRHLNAIGVSAVILLFMCLWNVLGVGAFDYLNGP